MTDVHPLQPMTRLLSLALLAGAALLLNGCADGPPGANEGSSCPDGSTDCTTPPPVTCPVAGQTFHLIPVEDALVSTVNNTGICIGCTIEDAIDVVDIFTNNFAIMTVSVGLLGAGNSITVTDTADHFPVGSVGGFVVAVPKAPVATLDLLRTVRVTDINNGVDTVDSAGASAPLVLQLLGILGNPALAFVSAGPATVPFNAVRLNLGGVVDALTQLDVYGAGVCE